MRVRSAKPNPEQTEDWNISTSCKPEKDRKVKTTLRGKSKATQEAAPKSRKTFEMTDPALKSLYNLIQNKEL